MKTKKKKTGPKPFMHPKAKAIPILMNPDMKAALKAKAEKGESIASVVRRACAIFMGLACLCLFAGCMTDPVAAASPTLIAQDTLKGEMIYFDPTPGDSWTTDTTCTASDIYVEYSILESKYANGSIVYDTLLTNGTADCSVGLGGQRYNGMATSNGTVMQISSSGTDNSNPGMTFYENLNSKNRITP